MMKRIIGLLLLGLIVMPKSGWSQSCCAKPSNMQALAMNVDFKAAHADPEPHNFAPQRGVMTTFPADSANGQAYFVPSAGPSNKVLLVFHEWWGLNDYIKEMVDKLNQDLGDVNIYAIDLYDGKVATKADNAAKLMAGLSQKRVRQLLGGITRYLGPDRKIATLGWCMGGTYALQSTRAFRRQAAGVVMYYGFPDKQNSNPFITPCDVLYIRGTKDKFISEQDVEGLKAMVKKSNNDFQLVKYNADHAFANPSNPNHDVAATQQAYDRAIAFIRSHLEKSNSEPK